MLLVAAATAAAAAAEVVIIRATGLNDLEVGQCSIDVPGLSKSVKPRKHLCKYHRGENHNDFNIFAHPEKDSSRQMGRLSMLWPVAHLGFNCR